VYTLSLMESGRLRDVPDDVVEAFADAYVRLMNTTEMLDARFPAMSIA